nr:neutral alpha glucosidase AB [Hymenolepis microstoma]
MRQRNFWPSSPQYLVDVATISSNENVIQFQLIKKLESEKRLSFNLTYHDGRTFRLVLDEADPISPRFRPRIGDSLIAEPQPLPLKVQKNNSEIVIIAYTQDKVVIKTDPFKILIYSKDSMEMTINDRDLLNFEHQLEPQFINISQTKETTTATAETVALPAENESESIQIPEPTDPTEPPPTGPIRVDWSESFNGHRDSRPHGPTSIGLDFTFHGFEHVFGIPEHADSFSLRDTNKTDPYRLFNLDVFEYELNNPMALYGSVPLMWAHKANTTVGLFINNPSEAWIDVESSREADNGGLLSNFFSKSRPVPPYVKTRWMFETGVFDIFVILADSPHSGLKSYAALTGVTPLPPLFAISHHQSRWNYRDQDEMKAVNDGYVAHYLPVDSLWLDIEYTNNKRYLHWDTVKFPNPDQMVDELTANGRKLVVIFDPHIKVDHNWPTCSQAKEGGFYVKKLGQESVTDFDGWCWPGSSYWPDFYRAEVVDWWANLLTDNKFLSSDRMFYVWNDMNEPSVFSGAEVTIPRDTIFGDVWENRDLHNLYGLWVHNATWEGLLRRSNRTERPFVLTRAFFAGSQRTSAVWTGDNLASWEHLQITTPMLLSLSMTGLTFCGADVGGFFRDPSSELYTRWYQAGAFHPFLRSHAHIDTSNREPWNYDAPYFDAIRDALRLRYSLLPYWYTLFALNERDASPPMAPLFYHFPTDERTFAIDNAFMVGDALLVHPVVHEGAKSVDVYLPNGIWYLQDDWTIFSGNQEINLPVDLRTIPLFYRGGFIIAKKGRPRRSSAMMIYDPYTIVIALDDSDKPTATGYLYMDDYHSTDLSTARLYRMEYASSTFKFTRIEGSNNPETPLIERVVIMSPKMTKPSKVYVSTPDGMKRDIEFSFTNSDGSRSALLVLRKPLVKAEDGWKLHIE